MKQGTPLDPQWDDIPYFFVEHWGEFATALCINPPLDEKQQSALVRRMELDGSYLIHRHLTPPDVANFHEYLATLLPQVWGPMQDIARLALFFSCDPALEWNIDAAQRLELARRFPCPMMFHLPSDSDWNKWARARTFLLGSQVELYPASLGTLGLAPS
ncbi:MAG: hypothetical protein EP343_30050 [Deltaproteobacteria bacterium]|nr:MAG: hypothetical protein EP343_30050 [Deltaproteobacteria bacterium]